MRFPDGDTPYALRTCVEMLKAKVLMLETVASGAAAASEYYKVGYGDPNGVVTARPGSTYIDITDPNASVHYIKSGTTTSNTGWI